MERVTRELTVEEELQRKIDEATVRITNEVKREVLNEWAQWAADQGEDCQVRASGWAGCVRALGPERISQMDGEIAARMKAWKANEGIE